MLAVWRVHGFDRILREAWESGIVLSGNSAGMICWFEAAVTDSIGPSLATMSDGLGFLPGSACPHYDDEELRRPLYRRAVDDGFPPGYAADSGVGLHFVSTELAEVITSREGATGYRVEPGVETPLPARLVG
jgi:dipeptidase E